MNDQDFSQRAPSDPDFRRQQIAVARYQQKLAVVGAGVMVLGWIGYVAFARVIESRWPGDVGVGIGLVVCATLFVQARSRHKRLTTMSE